MMNKTAANNVKKIRIKPQNSIHASIYNLILGGCIFYGLVLNLIIVLNFSHYFSSIHPIPFFFVGLAIILFGEYIAVRSKKPLVSLIGYTLVVLPLGAELSVCLPNYALEDIRVAIIITTCVIAVMMVLATLFPRFFTNMGRALFFSLFASVIGETIAFLNGNTPTFYNWLFVILYTLYVGYDWHKAQSCPKTIDNAIDYALKIYLDILGLFIRILRIISKSKGKRR